MKSIRDWAFPQIISNTLAMSRPLSGSGGLFSEEPQDHEYSDSGPAEDSSVIESQALHDASFSSESQESLFPCSQQSPGEESLRPHECSGSKKLDTLSKIEALRFKFLHALNALGQSQDDLLVAKVLYRLHLATLIRAGESDLKRINLKSDTVKAVATEQGVTEQLNLEFSLKVLVLGRTGVGKSATINSIFGQSKAVTDAFRPATDRIHEVSGTVNGVNITVIDTPGFWPSSSYNMRRNRKIMHSIKRYIRKSPPDVILYFERLDLVDTGHNDYLLLKLITDVFGSAIWFNTILVFSHAGSSLPEASTGYLSYESYVARRTDILQRYIYQAVSDTKLEIPVVLVENHLGCRTNAKGEKLLPDGQVWKPQLLLLCISTKVLRDANSILGFHDSIELGSSTGSHLPSLPHLLSSLLRQQSSISGAEDGEGGYFLPADDEEEEDEYDQLPPIRILTKPQFAKLSKSQRRDYLDELDYRETLFLKKQMKQEAIRRRENKVLGQVNLNDGNSDFDPSDEPPPEATPLPDMEIPLSFDSDYPVHRYRCLVTSEQWLWRPVLDPHGWDHDVGFDGINMENTAKVTRNTIVSVSGQMSKDKQDISIQSECSAAYVDPKGGPTYIVGLDLQSTGNKDLIYTLHSNAQLKSMKRNNVSGCGVSVTSYKKKHYLGAKLENTLSVGKRVTLAMNGGRVDGQGESAYGGTLEGTVRGRDYPVRNNKVKMGMTFLSFNKEMVLGGTLESDFRPTRGLQFSVSANLNNRGMGQVRIKTTSSEHIEIALVAVFALFRALCKGKTASENVREMQ